MTPLRAVVVLTALALAGCASSRGIVPEHPKERYSLPSWPRQSVSLEVVDARTRREDSARLVQVTTATLSEAMRAAGAPPGPPQHLRVEIMVHDVSLQGPVWIATTIFRAMLLEEGRVVRTWDARGEQRRINWLPADAKTATQQAYERGLADLVTKLEKVPP